MSIEISTLTNPDDWNDLVEKSPQSTPFHRYEALEVLAEHSGSELYPYAGFKGQEPVGLFPIFELSKGPISTAFSPPPDLKITYLGPVLVNHQKQKQRRKERTNRRFIDGCLERMEEAIDPKFTHIRTGTGYTDARPFVWSDYGTTTRYTYCVDLRPSEEDIIMEFSSDARRNIRRTDESEYEIYDGDESDVKRTIERIKERHNEQGVSYSVTPQCAADLYSALPDESAHIYVCEVDGEFVGGHIALQEGNVVYGWQSWGSFECGVPVNDLLDWTIMQTGRDRGAEWYDLVGANNARISKYKSKFSPELWTYQRIQNSAPGMNVASKLYKRIR